VKCTPILLAVAGLVTCAGFVTSAAGSSTSLNGVFDTGCKYSHTARDDPLLHPRRPGASHLHEFFGNRATDARSSGKSLLDTPATAMSTTCGDKRDRSAYWAPALYQDGRRLAPEKVHVYYRHHATLPAKPFPLGFGMIARNHWWSCGPGSAKHRDGTVPACPNGRLFVVLSFPACWDGVRLFSQDGSHVSHGNKRCDPAHPVRLPRLAMLLSYRVDGKPHQYVLSSGSPQSAHADFLNAWEPDRLAQLVDKCLNHGRTPGCEKDTS
jgi:hypothetical protein